jgi:hypothetical protein
LTVAVVTPCFRPDVEWLLKAHESVKAQAYPCRHFLVVDGPEPLDLPGFQGTFIQLPHFYRDFGVTPRLLGCMQAIATGAEAIAFLDDDNWLDPQHVANLLGTVRSQGADFAASARMLHQLDGTPMMRCPHVDGVKYVDTNCMLLLPSAYDALIGWALCPPKDKGMADQFFWRFAMRRGKRFAFTPEATIFYRTRHAAHYRMAGLPLPPGVIDRTDQSGEAYDRL